MAKKTSKKYAVSRKEISGKIEEMIDGLSNIDTFLTSPSDVSDALRDIGDSLHSLLDDVGAEG